MEWSTPQPESPLWKTRQVARALGLSVSTVKRLVDSGEIQAARTSGRHRLIAPEEALRYARERRLPGADLELLVGPGSRAPLESEAGAVENLVSALRRGRAEEARALIRSAHVALGGAGALADRLIRPAMEALGHDWEVGSLEVYQEHRATRLVEAALMDLVARVARERSRMTAAGPLALGAATEGDPYTLAGLLCELALREQGWEVMNLGPNLPLPSLARAVLTHQPRLVWITVGYLADPARFAREYRNFYAAASRTGASVILGGQALEPRLRADLVAAGFGERVAHLVEFARGLYPEGTRPGRPEAREPATDGRPSERPDPGKTLES